MRQKQRSIAEFLQTQAAGRLLAILADGQFHTSASLAEVMQCPLTQVPKAIALLRSAGLELSPAAASDVRLPGGLELLEADKVLAACGPVADHLSAVKACLSVASTNDTLLEQARAGAPSGTVCLAEWQGAGRGRRDRRWISPLAGSIYLSLLWRFSSRPPDAALSLMAGAALARRLTDLGVDDLSLKWPNDLQWRGRKLAGVLIDVGPWVPGAYYVVIGIGLNYRLPPLIREQIDQPVATLVEAMAPRTVSRNVLAGELLAALVPELLGVEIQQPSDWRRHWHRYDCTRNQKLRVLLPAGGELQGIGAGIRGDGALLVDDGCRIHPVLAGDVRVRVLP